MWKVIKNALMAIATAIIINLTATIVSDIKQNNMLHLTEHGISRVVQIFTWDFTDKDCPVKKKK